MSSKNFFKASVKRLKPEAFKCFSVRKTFNQCINKDAQIWLEVFHLDGTSVQTPFVRAILRKNGKNIAIFDFKIVSEEIIHTPTEFGKLMFGETYVSTMDGFNAILAKN